VQREGSFIVHLCVLAIEDRPAQRIPQPLIVKHEFSNLAGKLGALPLALQTTSLHTFSFRGCRACRPDRVCRCAKFVRCHMRHRRSLSSSVSSLPCSTTQCSGSAHSVSGGGTGLRHRNFTAYPGVRLLNRLAWTVIIDLYLLEEMQDVLRAIRRPHGKQAMIGVQ
jgi:hypothetical protein